MKPKKKSYKCVICGERYEEYQHIRNRLPLGKKYCDNPECKKQFFARIAKKEAEKIRKNKDKEWRERKSKTRFELDKGVNDKEYLQREVNWIVNKIDEHLPCICGYLNVREWHAMHYYSRGASPALRFNVWNIFRGSHTANVANSGDEIKFRNGLIQRYGIEMYDDKIESLKSKYKSPMPWIYEDIKYATKEARKIVRAMKKGEIFTRDEVNYLLKLYKS